MTNRLLHYQNIRINSSSIEISGRKKLVRAEKF